jgi:hypothetical protein
MDLTPLHRRPEHPEEADDSRLRQLLDNAIRLNMILLGLTMGATAGVGLFLGTHISLAVTGDKAGRYLNLLGVFLPGYSASPGGACMGLLWGFIVGAFSGCFIYSIYARSLRREFAEISAETDEPEKFVVEQPVLRISGHVLGISLGSLMALQLIATTNWLVVRGTAGQSPHAALLQNYFPGYSVSFVGSMIGAAEIFIFTYVLSQLLSAVYNLVADLRRGRAVR